MKRKSPPLGPGLRDELALSVFLFVLAACFDASKALWWPSWAPSLTLGPALYFRIASWSAGFWIVSAIAITRIPSWTVRFPVVGALFALSGVLSRVPLGINEVMMPTIWHSTFGVIWVLCALLLLHVRHIAAPKLVAASREHPERRNELYEVLRICLQVLIGFSAIFGVAMTIIFTGGATKLTQGSNALTDPDLQATAMQMSLGFFGCVSAMYFWGIVPILKRLHD